MLYGGLHDDLRLIQHSNNWNLSYGISADISRHQRKWTIVDFFRAVAMVSLLREAWELHFVLFARNIISDILIGCRVRLIGSQENFLLFIFNLALPRCYLRGNDG